MSVDPTQLAPAPIFRMQRSYGGAAPELSVVLPMFNEEKSAALLIDEIAGQLIGLDYEIVAVDDCSADGTVEALKSAQGRIPRLRIVRHGSNAGQSRALRSGILAARAAVVATLDGDGQNDPADVKVLYESLTRPEAPIVLAMVAGERTSRRDPVAKKRASLIANSIRRRVLHDGAADTGCGLKVFYRDAYLRLPYFDHCHRYLPALMAREGFAVEFLPVNHRPRAFGTSKYDNLQRLAVAFRDLFGVVWLKARARSPLTISELEPGDGYDTVR